MDAQDYYQGVGAKGTIVINNHGNLQNQQYASTSSVYSLFGIFYQATMVFDTGLSNNLQYPFIHW